MRAFIFAFIKWAESLLISQKYHISVDARNFNIRIPHLYTQHTSYSTLAGLRTRGHWRFSNENLFIAHRCKEKKKFKSDQIQYSQFAISHWKSECPMVPKFQWNPTLCRDFYFLLLCVQCSHLIRRIVLNHGPRLEANWLAMMMMMTIMTVERCFTKNNNISSVRKFFKMIHVRGKTIRSSKYSWKLKSIWTERI